MTAVAAATLPAKAAFTGGNLIVLTSTTTGTANAASAAALTLSEYAYDPATGTFASTATTHALPGITLPENGGDHDGLLHLSTDGNFLTFGGYAAAPATTGVVAGVVASAATRLIGSVDSNFVLTTTAVTGYTGLALRSVVSTDGKHFWTGGDQTATPTDGGQYYVDATGPAVTQTLVNAADARGNVIDRGQLWSISSSAGGATKVGAGLPTSAAAQTLTLPGGYAKSDVVFLDLDGNSVSDTAYTTDGKNLIGKWHYDGSAWSAAGVFSGTKTSITDINSLQAFAYNGVVRLLAATNAGQLFQFTDTHGMSTGISFAGNTTPTPYLTAPAGTVFRGMAIAVPEPAALATFGVGVAGLLRRRRKTRAA